MATESVDTIDDRAVSEQLARCVATMVYYQADGWSWSAAQLLWEEARSLRAWAEQTGLGAGNGLDEFVLTPLRDELAERFGATLGFKLHREFLRAMRHAAAA